jgi:hypothetical protein
MTKRRDDKSSTEDPSEQSDRLFSDEMVDRLKNAITFGEPIPTLPKSKLNQKARRRRCIFHIQTTSSSDMGSRHSSQGRRMKRNSKIWKSASN